MCNYIQFNGVSILINGCGVLQFVWFYDINFKIYKILPRPYMGSYVGRKTDFVLSKIS